jgi:hypothetical protein
MVVKIDNVVFWVMTPCSMVSAFWRNTLSILGSKNNDSKNPTEKERVLPAFCWFLA